MDSEEQETEPSYVHILDNPTDGQLFNADAIVEGTIWTQTDTIVSMMVFFFGIAYQNELQHDPYYCLYVLGFIIVVIIGTQLMEALRVLLAKATIQRINLVKLLIKIVYIPIAFAGGLFARSIVDSVITMPRLGKFGMDSLFMPFVIIIMVLIFLFRNKIFQDPAKKTIVFLQKPITPKDKSATNIKRTK
jgi:hypothetical protein